MCLHKLSSEFAINNKEMISNSSSVKIANLTGNLSVLPELSSAFIQYKKKAILFLITTGRLGKNRKHIL